MDQVVRLIGNLGDDPEMRYLPSGQAVTNFRMATNRKWNDQNGQKQEETTWWRISAWGANAENANQYLSKGDLVQVKGRMVIDPETGGPRVFTRNDGTTGASFELNAQFILFLKTSGSRGGQVQAQDFGDVDEDDIPF